MEDQPNQPELMYDQPPRPNYAEQLGLQDGGFRVLRTGGQVETGWNIKTLHEYTPAGTDQPTRGITIMKTESEVIRLEDGSEERVTIESEKSLPLDTFMSWQQSPEDTNIGSKVSSILEAQKNELAQGGGVSHIIPLGEIAQPDASAEVIETANDIAELGTVEESGVEVIPVGAETDVPAQQPEATEVVAPQETILTGEQKAMAQRTIAEVHEALDLMDKRDKYFADREVSAIIDHYQRSERVQSVPGLVTAMKAAALGSMRNMNSVDAFFGEVVNEITKISGDDNTLAQRIKGVVGNFPELAALRARGEGQQDVSSVDAQRQQFADYASDVAENLARQLDDPTKQRDVRALLHGLAMGVAPSRYRGNHTDILIRSLTR